ncbi:MAG: AmmeMemoRadiSam system radical SAM enzyme [Thermoplasmata archaeon]|nr:MAG: AmmeMemoRadiSam system radical SAM enzyme [Thermoplasmata archaeon]MCD6222560.1 AmmeMemoRadiSam system radical SAM enzyme [Thermoplasmata archaeon]
MEKIAKFWEKKNNVVRCRLCPHNCIIREGKRGVCKVRENRNGKLYTLVYASCSSANVDPIEKKPLFHFYPGSLVYSLSTVGCNLKCLHCQNYAISQITPEEAFLIELPPEKAVGEALKTSDGIAFTYNEPTIWWEYAYDTSKLAKKHGLYTVFVTNGYINEEPLKEIAPYLDAANVDIKSMDDEFYRRITRARLQPVLQAAKLYKELGIHLEMTYLIIPTKNDAEWQIKKFIEWVLNEFGDEQVVHFTAFYPTYKMMHIPPTPLKTLVKAYEMAKQHGLKYVYLGNVPHGEYENTYCPKCGNLLIERHGFHARIVGLKNGKCSKCGAKIPVIMD